MVAEMGYMCPDGTGATVIRNLSGVTVYVKAILSAKLWLEYLHLLYKVPCQLHTFELRLACKSEV